ncbi:cation:proton antiporter [Streptomyces durbertensis]|uniref:Cation:proton antiporter n=1 Tax=Streptomyces durbertensis TaxID=2448886 RepID=A0ABR6EL02_9ACTN|nr:cation:proton antiporter [Streptomyces durbertensis]MBB1246009.1 cation:proton antiporter [Streptomyces durbertensis]
MSQVDLFRVLAALALLLTAAHLVGRLFARYRQPPVIGEILGGLLLGPTVLGRLLPDVQGWLFPDDGPAASALALVHLLGMLLLMFVAGMEMRTVFSREDGRPVLVIALAGMVVPFALGLLAVRLVDTDRVIGPAGDVTALTLVVACAIAVTSIPVISRIMLDLGIIRTRFARMVLSVAVLEDIVLNVILSVALGMVAGSHPGAFGLSQSLGVTSANGSALYHSVASVAFFALAVLAAVALRRLRGAASPGGAARTPGTVAVRMAVILAVAASCVFLGVAPMFGAFVVGLLSGAAAGARRAGPGEPLAHLRAFASGFFIPVYFAVVGLKLDLFRSFDLWLTAGFVLVACLAKATSVYAGARLARQPKAESLDLAVALNARGGPGIVLATVSFDAGIVNAPMFTTLVLTAIVTSQIAGWWLERAVSRGAFPPDGPGDGPARESPQAPRPEGHLTNSA